MTIRKFLVVLASFALIVAACGDDGADDTTTAAPQATTAAPAATTAAPGTTAAPATTAAPDPMADWPDKLVFGFVPSQEVSELQDDVDTFAGILSDALGIEVAGIVTTDYTGLGVAMGTGEADMGAFGPAGYVLASENFDNLELLAQSVRFGDSTYHGQWYTNDASLCGDAGTEEGAFYYDDAGNIVAVTADNTPALQVGWDFGDDGLFRNEDFSAPTRCAETVSLDVVKGKKIAWTTETSTSGFIFPTLELRAAGIADDEYEAVFAGGHDGAITTVYNGDADIGVSFDDARRTIRNENTDVGEKVIVFNITPRIANDVIAIRSDLPESLKEALFTAMADYIATDEGAEVMGELYSWTDLTRAGDVTLQSLDAIKRAIDELGFTD